jgi:hypothetical protein
MGLDRQGQGKTKMHDVSVFIGVSNTPVDGHRRLSVFY